MFAIELLADYLIGKGFKDLKEKLTTGSRLMGILIWPIGMAIFVYNFIKAKYRL